MMNLQEIEESLEMWIDTTRIWENGSVYKIKALIATVNDLRITIRPMDHFPPHFHVTSRQRGINASFSLHDLEPLRIKGEEIREDDIKKIKSFFDLHKDKLTLLKEEYKRLQG